MLGTWCHHRESSANVSNGGSYRADNCAADRSRWEKKRGEEREREGERACPCRTLEGVGGWVWSQRSLFGRSPSREEQPLKLSIMAELSSAQVTECNWALLSRRRPVGFCCAVRERLYSLSKGVGGETKLNPELFSFLDALFLILDSPGKEIWWRRTNDFLWIWDLLSC